tara:strand:- start:284 stop:706 length:423 start_codon:yes stop_codon:yes gene_type:complete
MAKKIKNESPIKSLAGYGGQRALRKKIERSTTIASNKEAIAHTLLSVANTTVMDVMSWDENGVFIKDSKDITSIAAQAIKKVRFTPEGKIIDIEFHDKGPFMRLLAQASGMLDKQDQSDKPSVIGINVKSPETIDNGEDT